MFPSFVARKDMMKMKKLGQKKALEASYEGPYLFVGYVNGKEEVDLMKEDTSTSLKDLMKLSGNDHKEIYNFFILEHDLMGTTKV